MGLKSMISPTGSGWKTPKRVKGKGRVNRRVITLPRGGKGKGVKPLYIGATLYLYPFPAIFPGAKGNAERSKNEGGNEP
jgi:hypothetical protein